jgi:hypothetical protein
MKIETRQKPRRLHAPYPMRRKMMKQCEVCDAPFLAYRPPQRYCCHECADIAKLEQARERYAANLEAERARGRAYARAAYAGRGDEIRAINREWQTAHRDIERERQRRWQSAHRDKTREYCRRWRAKKRAEACAPDSTTQ